MNKNNSFQDKSAQEQSIEFLKLANELKVWFSDRDLALGMVDTYYGHLALLIQEKLDKQRAEVAKAVAKEVNEANMAFYGTGLSNDVLDQIQAEYKDGRGNEA